MSYKLLLPLVLSSLIAISNPCTRAQPQGGAPPAQPNPDAGLTRPTVLPAPYSAITIVGTVERYLMNPGGQADGLLLSDGKQLHFPPHLSSALLQVARPGDQIEATAEPGLQSKYGQEFRTISLTNTRTRQVVIDQPPAYPPAPPAPGQLLTVSGAVSNWLVGHFGEVRGLLLSDGSEVHFPPPLQQSILAAIKRGDRVSVQGYGTRSSIGTCLDATGMTVNGKSLSLFGMAP